MLKPVAVAILTGGFSLHVKLADKGLREFGRFARKNKFVAEAVQIGGCAAVTIGTGGAGAAGCGVITSAVTYGVTDGDTNAALKAGAIAFVQADIANYIGHGSGLGKVGMVVAHGGLGGLVSVAQGGKFGSGFAAGAFGKSVTLGLSGTGLYAPGANGGFDNTGVEAVAARTAIAAIAGGIGSELSGGQFANGAVTGAMQHLFNAESGVLDYLKKSFHRLSQGPRSFGYGFTFIGPTSEGIDAGFNVNLVLNPRNLGFGFSFTRIAGGSEGFALGGRASMNFDMMDLLEMSGTDTSFNLFIRSAGASVTFDNEGFSGIGLSRGGWKQEYSEVLPQYSRFGSGLRQVILTLDLDVILLSVKSWVQFHGYYRACVRFMLCPVCH